MLEELRLPPQEPVGELVWVAGGKIDKASVSLRFFGEDLDPDEFTTTLGVSPSDACRKGDIFRGKRHDRVEKHGKWLLQSEKSVEDSLEDLINKLLDLLTTDLKVWRDLTTRFDGDLFCGLWLKEWNRGTSLTAKTLKRVADRNLSINFDIYYVGDEDDAK